MVGFIPEFSVSYLQTPASFPGHSSPSQHLHKESCQVNLQLAPVFLPKDQGPLLTNLHHLVSLILGCPVWPELFPVCEEQVVSISGVQSKHHPKEESLRAGWGCWFGACACSQAVSTFLPQVSTVCLYSHVLPATDTIKLHKNVP